MYKNYLFDLYGKLIDINTDEPVVFNCKKCNKGGIINQEFIDNIGFFDGLTVPKYKGTKRLDVAEHVSSKIPNVNVTENDNILGVVNYINKRIGVSPSLEDLQKFQYVGNPRQYVLDYLAEHVNERALHNRHWFKLTNGSITGRYNDDSIELRWLFYKSENVKASGMYRINTPVDLNQHINVVISEGIMDSIGLFYHSGFRNCIFISVLCSNYQRGIQYVIDRGLFGRSVSIKIFKDSDVKNVYIDKKYEKLFKDIEIYENLGAKDFGVPIDKLDIQKWRR